MPLKNNQQFKQLPTANPDVHSTPLDTNDLITLMSDLLSLNTGDINALFKAIAIHLKGTYKHKDTIEQTLSLVHKLLNTPTIPNNIKVGVAGSLHDGFLHCSQGLHIRVNEAYMKLNLPKNLSELLTKLRYDHIDEIAHPMVSVYPVAPALQVHLYHLIFNIAHELEYVSCAVPDVFINNVNDALGHNRVLELRDKIKLHVACLNAKCTLFSITVDLVDKIKHSLMLMGYQGTNREEEGYRLDVYGPIFSYLKQFFQAQSSEEWTIDHLFMIEYGKKLDDTKIIDVNWMVVKKCLIQSLINEGYFVVNQQEMSLLNELFSTEQTGAQIQPVIQDLQWDSVIKSADELDAFLSLFNDYEDKKSKS